MAADEANSPTIPEAEAEVRALYGRLLASWNARNAADFAAAFAYDGHSIGFDGTQSNGAADIETSLAAIFRDHGTATYVSKIRGVDLLGADVAILRAIVGMLPPGKTELMPERNAIQSVVAIKRDNRWRIALFQNTPAAFDGRPELVKR